MNKNQNGFAILEALLILVIITVISGVGWYAIHTKHQTDKILAQSEKTSQSTPSTNSRSPKYLTIKEWGVKVKLSSNDSGAYYRVADQTQKDSYGVPENIDVFSSESDALKGPAGISCKGEYIAKLLRLSADDNAWSDPLTSGYYPNPVQIGSHKYAASSAKQYGPGCWLKDSGDLSSPDETTMNQFKAIASQFVQDFNTVQIN